MDAIAIIDKPAGMTSHDVVYRLRRLLNEKRIGHTGTLDPFATGVLVMMIGRGTRLARYLNTDEKEYLATIRFGFATDTGDLTGQPVESPDEAASRTAALASMSFPMLDSAMGKLRGNIKQVPPMYSAKRIAGKRLYELARKGKTVEREAVSVTVREFDLVGEYNNLNSPKALFKFNADGTADFETRVVCSAGTYVRSLAESLGSEIDVPAHLATLRRTRAGRFDLSKAVTLEEIAELMERPAAVEEKLLSLASALPDMPFMHLSDGDAQKVRNGAAIRGSQIENVVSGGKEIRLLDEHGTLLAVAEFDKSSGLLKPEVVLQTENKN